MIPRSRRALVSSVAMLALSLCAAAQSGDQGAKPPTAESDMPAVAETPAERDQRMAWWREARFGMFVHWGLYAVPAGVWGDQTTHGEWIRDTARIPIDEYDKLRARFNPVKFDADAWAKIARDAGMKYIVITSKHHDGFCLFDSEFTDFDVMSTPFRRDIMKELAEACGRAGLKICWYHSIMDWHHSDYLPRRAWETRPAEGAAFASYNAHLRQQVRELLTKYGPIGVLWFDGEWEPTWTHEQGRALYDYVRRLQPGIIVNNRVDKGRNDMAGLNKPGEWGGDFGTPEQEIPATGLPGQDWETCMTMNEHWGYNAADKNFKSARELLRMLADIASKGGNFLLNVGPTAAGEIPPESVERLAEMGRWMRVNGEAIYGTQASPFRALPWGRCTQKTAAAAGQTRLYLHVFDWPADGELVVPGIFNDAVGAYALADEQRTALHVTRREDALVVQVARAAPDAVNSVIVLDVAGRPDVAAPPVLTAEHPIFVDALEVHAATDRVNVEVRYTLDGSDPKADSPRVAGPIRLTQTTIVSARAFRGGRSVSGVARATYEQVTPRPAESPAGLTSGVGFEYYEGTWDFLPDFDSLSAANAGHAATFDYAVRSRDERFGLRFRGFIEVPRSGVYTFYTSSDDGSRLFIGDRLVVDNDGPHSTQTRSGVLALTAGLHPITVTFFERTGDDSLSVEIAGPGLPRQVIPAEMLRRKP